MSQRKDYNKKKNTEKDESLDRLASVGEIAAGMAHEIRNPLTAVKGFLDLMKNESPHSYLDIASSELERAISTLQDLLNVSKPDLDNEPFVSINLCSELESIINLFQDQVYRVDIIKNFKNKNINIQGRRNQLKKVFFNIIKNAHEAIENKGTITIEHYKKEDNVIVKIQDTGVGIPKEKLAVLGTPFFTTKNSGTGLGLVQVFTTVNNHGGEIKVDSELQKGTSFTLKFPIGEEVKIGGYRMDLKFEESMDYKSFIEQNIDALNNQFLHISKEIVEQLDLKDNIDENYLYDSALKIFKLLEENREHELIMQAKQKGEYWAKLDISLIFKLEWIQNFFQAYRDLNFYYHSKVKTTIEEFYSIIDDKRRLIDRFTNSFISSYTHYKNNLIKSQRELVESLSVPIIPLSDRMAVLPIIGTIDTYRAKSIQERTLQQIRLLSVEKLFIDLSGVSFMDSAVVNHLFKIVDGVRLLGCKTIITGIRPEVANTIIEMGIKITDYVEAKGSLQQALEDSGLKH